jgi:DNA-binding transcriptional ArsR family regulator
MKESIALTTLEEIKAFSDPYRLQILDCFYQFAKPATVKQIADKIGEIPAKVHYHVKKLEKTGILCLVYTEEIKGIMAKYYEPTAKHFEISNKNVSECTEKVLKSHVEKVVHETYSMAERNFLEQIQKGSKADEVKGHMSEELVYLTQKELNEFNEYIDAFCKRHNERGSEEHKEAYYLFSSIIRKLNK